MNVLIIGDLHGNPHALENTLRRVGAIDRDGAKRPDWFVGSVGDLINGAPSGADYRGFVSDDVETLRRAFFPDRGPAWVDLVALGNHEGYLTHGIHKSWWVGAAEGDEVDPNLLSYLAPVLAGGRYVAAIRPPGTSTLVTHAGLDPTFWPRPVHGYPADTVAISSLEALLNNALQNVTRNPFPASGHPEITAAGRAVGGRDPVGGILWMRPEECTGPQPFTQIVGHTPSPDNPRYDEALDTWYIDNGGYLAGEDGEVGAVRLTMAGDWEPV